MTNPSPDVRFNLVASSTDETLSFFGRYIPFWTNQAEKSWSYAEGKAKYTDIPKVASKFRITSSHYSINSVKPFLLLPFYHSQNYVYLL